MICQSITISHWRDGVILCFLYVTHAAIAYKPIHNFRDMETTTVITQDIAIWVEVTNSSEIANS